MSLVIDYPACKLIGGQINWNDDGSASSGVLGVDGQSAIDGLDSFIQITSAISIDSGDTFSKIEIEVKDSYGVRVTKEISTINGNTSVNDGEDGIDLTDPVLRVRALVKTTKCPNGKLIESFIYAKELKAVISDFDSPNVVKAVGTVAKFVRFKLLKSGTTSSITCDEGVQAYTGSEVGTFTGETIEPGDTLILEVVDDGSGTNTLLIENQVIAQLNPQVESNLVADHDFTDAEITPATLLAISGGAEIDSMSVIPKGNGVTISMGGGTSKIEVGRSKQYGGKDAISLPTNWVINNPSEVEINIIWDLK